jgi:hypothetical protein
MADSLSLGLTACAEIASLSQRRRPRGFSHARCWHGGVPGGHAIVAVRADDAKAQFGGFGGGGADMMTQMAPMLEMMKAKIGKRRFAMLMQTRDR